MQHKTSDVVAALINAAEQEPAPSGDELNAEMRRQFPGIGDNQLRRAYAVAKEELEESQREGIRAGEQIEALGSLVGSIFDGLPEGTTFGEAVNIKAAQGDPIALSYQDHTNGLEYRTRCALWQAAVEAHPDWNTPDNRRYRWTGQGDAPSTDVMIDWFQTNHAAEARAIERAMEEESA